MRLLRIAVFFFAMLGCFLYPVQAFSGNDISTVRVLIGNYNDVKIVSSGAFKVKDLKSGKTVFRNKANRSLRVAASGDVLFVGGANLNSARLVSSQDVFSVGGSTYEGELYIYPIKGKVQVINIVDMEAYLKSVVPGEILASSPPEALKAQAIASRSFTVYRILKSAGRFYDLTKNSQHYQGKLKYDARISEAVNSTKGKIMLYIGEVFGSYFHANCGGTTEYAGNIWKEETYPVSIKCPHCKGAKHYQWKSTLDVKTLEKKFKQAGYKLNGGIKALYPAKVSTVSPRTTVLTAQDASGKEYTLRSDKFRNIIGAKHIRSTNFDFAAYESGFVFTGKGWGHGVGMCQDGAVKMAKQGKNYKQILQFYYPDIKIKKA